jgi:hypothetical protein
MSHYLTLKGIGRPVAYFPKLGVYLESVTAGIFLCQIIYWHDKATSELGVYKTSEEIQEETGLTYREQVTARKKLCSLGLIEETNKRLEHKIYFKFNEIVFDEWLSGCLGVEIPERRKRISGNAENAVRRTTKTHFVLQENTQENTNIDGKPEKFVFRKALIDLGVNKNLVDDWLIVRGNKKASNTQTAFNGFVKQVNDSGLDAETVLKICVDKSWSGFKKSWLSNIDLSEYQTEPKELKQDSTFEIELVEY